MSDLNCIPTGLSDVYLVTWSNSKVHLLPGWGRSLIRAYLCGKKKGNIKSMFVLQPTVFCLQNCIYPALWWESGE
jgi:hypothetical protein